MGSGLGKNTVWRGDYDIQLFDPAIRHRFQLDRLRFGDFVAICEADTRHGPAYRQAHVTVGVVVHGDSTVSGHGPGVTPLLTGPAHVIKPFHHSSANLAVVFGVRSLPPARAYQPLSVSASVRAVGLRPFPNHALPGGYGSRSKC